MAKDAKASEDSEQPAPPPSKKKKLLIIVGGLVLLLVIGLAVGAAVLLLKPHPEPTDDEEDVSETAKPAKKADKKKELPPVYVALEPFTVNLVPETGDQYLQVVISLECTDPVAEAQIKARMPRIRNGITLLLSGKKASELTSREGKEKLAGELKESINAVFPQEEPAPKKGKKSDHEEPSGELVKDVLFTSFIIQ
ncbi:MAG TPA: flagellar basal body-associated FliL family protein [Rhodocyclaceae bacterium]|nr:flagellar basal body-associated FliL family protein [Rhodocyclaceae bacterium]